MLLTLLLVMGICFSENVTTKGSEIFDLRGNCLVLHSGNTYTATCNGENIKRKNLILNGPATKYMREITLTSLESVTFNSSVEISRISVSKTSRVSLFVNNPSMTDLTIDSVDELTLVYQPWIIYNRVKLNIVLNNVKTLLLVSPQDFLWYFDSANLNNVGDIELGSSMLHIHAKHFTITNSNIRLSKKTSLLLHATSTTIDQSVLYIQKNGFMNLTVHELSVKFTKIYLEDGEINLSSKKTLFSNNLLYGFHNRSLSVSGDASVSFEENLFFTNDIVGILNLNKKNVSFKSNSFECNYCYVTTALVDVGLQGNGDVNYCYSTCNLTLNSYQTLLEESCLCVEGDLEVNHNQLCAPDLQQCLKPSVNFNLLWWVLLSLIPLLLIILLTLCFCFCLKKNRKKLKTVIENNIVKKNASTSNCAKVYRKVSDSSYATVEPVSDL